MRKETIGKMAEKRPPRHLPTEGERPSPQTNADIGAITKGSGGGPPKAEKGKPGARNAGTTSANQTTTTTFPTRVPKSFLNKLGEMSTAERELTLALPLVAKAAKSKDLKTLLNIHLKETKGHLKTLDQVAKSLGVELPAKGCKEMTRLIAEGVKVIAKRVVAGNQDARLIEVGRKIEQFEIGSYTPLCETAEENDWTHESALLTSILNQEKLADELLGDLEAGKGPLQELVENASLKKAGASPRKASRPDTGKRSSR